MRFAFFNSFNHSLFQYRDFIERYSINPLSRAFVINDSLSVEYALWGFTNDKIENYKNVPYHCKLETLVEKYYFNQSFLKQRLIVPANGFYEWRGLSRKTPYYLQSNEVTYLAGIGSFFDKFLSFALITYKSKNGKSRPIMMNEKESLKYLSYQDSIEFLKSLKDQKESKELTLAHFINNPKIDDASCLTPFIYS